MAEPQLSVRSAKARELAHKLARHERRSIADVVERALELYQVKQLGNEPATDFYLRLAHECATDFDLESEIRQERQPHQGLEL